MRARPHAVDALIDRRASWLMREVAPKLIDPLQHLLIECEARRITPRRRDPGAGIGGPGFEVGGPGSGGPGAGVRPTVSS